MTTLKNVLKTDNSNKEVISGKLKIRKSLKLVLLIFMLGWISLMSSCAVWVRGPEHHRRGRGHEIIIQDRHDNGRGHDNGRRGH